MPHFDDPIARLGGVVKRYGRLTALDGAELPLRRGELLALGGTRLQVLVPLPLPIMRLVPAARASLEMKVIIVTTFARPGFLRRALNAGVSGYLLKDAPAEKLAEALRSMHRHAAESVARHGAQLPVRGHRQARRRQPHRGVPPGAVEGVVVGAGQASGIGDNARPRLPILLP